MKKRERKEAPVRNPGKEPQTIDDIKKKAEGRPDEAYLTTGEVSRLLSGLISRSTVTRIFDRGSFEGRVNPLTGKREIKWQTVAEWLKGKGFAADKIAMIEKRKGQEWVGVWRKKTDSV